MSTQQASNLSEEFEHRGMISGAFPIADDSLLSTLADQSELYESAKRQLVRDGAPNRVPYFITDAVREMATDAQIISVIEALLGPNEPWVMWGANIREEIANEAHRWHVDSESTRWFSVTVAVGLAGCDANNSTLYIPGSHKINKPLRYDLSDNDSATLTEARVHNHDCDEITGFDNFGLGKFYVFNAKGWHRGQLGTDGGRKLLFLHYHRAADPRIPYMKDYRGNQWFEYPAEFIAGQGSRLLHNHEHHLVNESMCVIPPRSQLKGSQPQSLRARLLRKLHWKSRER